MPKPLIDHVAKILTACLVAAFPTSYGVSSPPPNGDHYQPGPSGVWFSAPGAEAMIEVRPHPDFFLGGGRTRLESTMLCSGKTIAGCQNSKCLLRVATFGSSSELCHIHFFISYYSHLSEW